MSLDAATALLLIVVPIVFNVAFLELGRAFDYPDILRREPDEILRRFHAGGTGLLLRWHLFMLTALALVPAAVLFAVVLGAAPALTVMTIVTLVVAALVQVLGLLRWTVCRPRARPALGGGGRRRQDEPTRQSIEVTFAVLHRYLGVGVGEHLGYLLTGFWTLLAAASIVTTTPIPAWLGWIGVPIGLALVIGSAEFAGPNKRDGWRLAGIIVPIAYVAWSIWLIALGVASAALTDGRRPVSVRRRRIPSPRRRRLRGPRDTPVAEAIGRHHLDDRRRRRALGHPHDLVGLESLLIRPHAIGPEDGPRGPRQTPVQRPDKRDGQHRLVDLASTRKPAVRARSSPCRLPPAGR